MHIVKVVIHLPTVTSEKKEWNETSRVTDSYEPPRAVAQSFVTRAPNDDTYVEFLPLMDLNSTDIIETSGRSHRPGLE